jgi:hypothetical protein
MHKLSNEQALIVLSCVPFEKVPARMTNSLSDTLLDLMSPLSPVPLALLQCLHQTASVKTFSLHEKLYRNLLDLIDREGDSRRLHWIVRLLIASRTSATLYSKALLKLLENPNCSLISLCQLSAYFGKLQFTASHLAPTVSCLKKVFLAVGSSGCWIVKHEMMKCLAEIGQYTCHPEVLMDIFPMKYEEDFSKFVSKQLWPSLPAATAASLIIKIETERKVWLHRVPEKSQVRSMLDEILYLIEGHSAYAPIRSKLLTIKSEMDNCG